MRLDLLDLKPFGGGIHKRQEHTMPNTPQSPSHDPVATQRNRLVHRAISNPTTLTPSKGNVIQGFTQWLRNHPTRRIEK